MKQNRFEVFDLVELEFLRYCLLQGDMGKERANLLHELMPALEAARKATAQFSRHG